MKIARKIFLIMILMGIIMFPLFTFVISTIVEENFSELEEQSVMININRVFNAYSNEINDITSTTNDWALWKETNDFVNQTYPEFIVNNLISQNFLNLRINFMIFYNVSDSLYYSKVVELTSGKSIALSDIFLKLISARIALLNHSSPTDGISGLLMICWEIFSAGI